MHSCLCEGLGVRETLILQGLVVVVEAGGGGMDMDMDSGQALS